MNFVSCDLQEGLLRSDGSLQASPAHCSNLDEPKLQEQTQISLPELWPGWCAGLPGSLQRETQNHWQHQSVASDETGELLVGASGFKIVTWSYRTIKLASCSKYSWWGHNYNCCSNAIDDITLCQKQNMVKESFLVDGTQDLVIVKGLKLIESRITPLIVNIKALAD